jgi:oligopeptidase B
METNDIILLKEEPVLGGYNRSLYDSKRIYATAPDGVRVPISLVFRKGLILNGDNLCNLYGYGSYGYTIDPEFRSYSISYLERGFVLAIAHIRGGGAYGRPWYEDGKLLKKKNTFSDFIAVAEHIINEKYTNPSKLVIQGASAGGLLMGAVINQAPHLFKAVILDVPFVDVINTMLDATLPLTVGEYEEWGNPNQKEYFDYMTSYSPYDNIADRDYPNLLLISALNDPRVMYWEPTKFIAKLRAVKKNEKNKVYLYRCFTEEGHGGASGRYEFLKEIAFNLVYFFDQLGIKK